MAYQQYSPEAIQEFRKKDLQTRKAGILITFYTAHKKLPTPEEMDEWLDLVYELTEKDKAIINPDYIPNTKDGAPFDEKKPLKEQLRKDLEAK